MSKQKDKKIGWRSKFGTTKCRKNFKIANNELRKDELFDSFIF